MNSLSEFFTQNIDVVFFIYGLAFFSMGLAVWLESRRSSEFPLAKAMIFLAGFGLIHGIHEWMDMFQRLGKFEGLSPNQMFFFNGLRIGDLVLSFLLLVIFGIRLIYANRVPIIRDDSQRTFSIIAAGALALFWLISVLLTRWIYQPDPEALVTSADVLARYITGIPGALLAAWAIILEQRSFKTRGMPDFGRALIWAALALILYGVIGQFFTNPSFIFPSNIINSDLFFDIFGFPIQLFRAIVATIIAIFIIRALRVFEIENQQQLATADRARLTAQEEALEAQRQSRRETEQLNRELQTAVQDLSLLFELSNKLAATLDKKTLLQETIGQIMHNLPRIDGGVIFLRENPEQSLQTVASIGFENQSNPRLSEQCSSLQANQVGEYVARTGQSAWCNGEEIIPLNDVQSLDNLQNRQECELVSVSHAVGVPLIVKEQVGGSLVLSIRTESFPFTERDLSLISIVAGQLSMAIENATLYQEVQDRDALRGELLNQVVSAQEHERQRIARELHDGTGQMLTALGLGLAAANENIQANPELAFKQLTELRALNTQALQEVHDVIADLRPSVLDNLGLAPALRSQIQALEARAGIHAIFTVTGERRRLHSDIETIIFRIAQEGLTNIVKHAEATIVDLCLDYNHDSLELIIQDDGVGFEAESALQPGVKERHAWGLLGMQERVALVGGSCEINSHPGAGTVIYVTIPLVSGQQ